MAPNVAPASCSPAKTTKFSLDAFFDQKTASPSITTPAAREIVVRLALLQKSKKDVILKSGRVPQIAGKNADRMKMYDDLAAELKGINKEIAAANEKLKQATQSRKRSSASPTDACVKKTRRE